MAWIFNSFRMVVVSLIPNLIPLLLTASIMGYFGIAIKPSTILVFSIAFGISVDDTIHFLAKYRQELKTTNNIRASVLASIKETGVSMIYTSGAPRKYVFLPIGVGACLFSYFVISEPYRLKRLLSFLNPWEHSSTGGFQIIQSFLAFQNGHLWGTGLGTSKQKLFSQVASLKHSSSEDTVC